MLHIEEDNFQIEGKCIDVACETANVLYRVVEISDEDTNGNLGDVVFATIVSTAVRKLYTANNPLAQKCVRLLASELANLIKEYEVEESEVKPS